MPPNPKRPPPHHVRVAQFAYRGAIGAALIAAAGLIVSSYIQSLPRDHDPPSTHSTITRTPPPPDGSTSTGGTTSRSSALGSIGALDQATPAFEPVYVTRTGEKYHRAGCRHIKGHDVTEMTVAEALDRGFGACRTCVLSGKAK